MRAVEHINRGVSQGAHFGTRLCSASLQWRSLHEPEHVRSSSSQPPSPLPEVGTHQPGRSAASLGGRPARIACGRRGCSADPSRERLHLIDRCPTLHYLETRRCGEMWRSSTKMPACEANRERAEVQALGAHFDTSTTKDTEPTEKVALTAARASRPLARAPHAGAKG
jgi:hypothetical protein